MMDDTFPDESDIPFLGSHDDIPVTSTPIKGDKVPLPSTRHVLKRMVQKSRRSRDFPPDFTASESIQAIQLSDTQVQHREPPLGHSKKPQGQPKGQGQPSTKAFSVDRDRHFDHARRNGFTEKQRQGNDFNHMYQTDNLRPKSSKDHFHLNDNAGLGSKRSEMHPLAMKPDKTPSSNIHGRISPRHAESLARSKQRDAETNRDGKSGQTERTDLYGTDTLSSRDNKTITNDGKHSLSDTNNSSYSNYMNSKKQWSNQQLSTDRPAVRTERSSTPESNSRVDTLTRIRQDDLDNSVNMERKRVIINSPNVSGHQHLSNKLSSAKKQNASFHELESNTLQKQRQEIQLLMSELKDRDRELDDMVAAHQQQLNAWEQDRHRLTTAENKCSQYEEELASRSRQLQQAVGRLQGSRELEGQVRRELQEAKASLEKLKAENQGLGADLKQEQTKSRNSQDKLTSLSQILGRLEAREEELATNLKLKERDMASATSQMGELSERLTQLDLRCKESQDRERQACRERDDWKHHHQRADTDRKTLSDELITSQEEVSRLAEENRSARQQLALVQKEMEMQEKCKDDLIESLKVKQDRTDSQLRNLRELYDRQVKEVAQLQLQLDTSREIIQRQQTSISQQQLNGSIQNRRSSGMSDYSMEKSMASQNSNQSSRGKQSPGDLAKYREPDHDMQSSIPQSSGYQSQLSDNQAARTKQSPVPSVRHSHTDSDTQSSNRSIQSSVYQSQSDNQQTRNKQTPELFAKYREQEYDMQSSNPQSSGYQSQLSENQTGFVPHPNLHNYSDQQTQYFSREAGNGDAPSNLKSSTHLDIVPKNVHFSCDVTKENTKQRLGFSEFSSSHTFASKEAAVNKNVNAQETHQKEKDTHTSDGEIKNVPKLSDQSCSELQSPPRQGGFVIQQTQIQVYPHQTEPRTSRPAISSNEVRREPVQEQREVTVTASQRETTAEGTGLSRQDREECDQEMEQRYVFENKLKSFLDDLDDIDDSIWEDKTNRSFSMSAAEGSPASKLQKLLLESRLMILSLEKSNESPRTSTSNQNDSSSSRHTLEKKESEV